MLKYDGWIKDLYPYDPFKEESEYISEYVSWNVSEYVSWMWAEYGIVDFKSKSFEEIVFRVIVF